jgi:hypothetical protein
MMRFITAKPARARCGILGSCGTVATMKRLLSACVVTAAMVFAACGGSTTPPSPDAAMKGAFGATCMTTSDMSTECQSGVCTDSINQLGHDVCSQKCTMTMSADPSCPVGSGGFCNGKGYCKP